MTYQFPGIALNDKPLVGDSVVWDGSKWTTVSAVDWASQSDWYLDADNGDDSNSGETPELPIASLAELERRIGTANLTPPEVDIGFGILAAPMKVHLLSDMPPEDSFSFRGAFSGVDSFLWFIGEANTVLASGTFSNVTNIVNGVTRPSVQVAGFDWTPYRGKRVRIVSTAAATPLGTVFWVEAIDANPEIAYISQPYAYSIDDLTAPFGRQTLTIGDGFVIEQLTAVGNLSCDTNSENGHNLNYGMTIEGVRFTGLLGQLFFLYLTSGHPYGCEINATFIRGWIDSYACRLGLFDFPTFKQTWETGSGQSFQTACSIQGDILIQSYGEFVVTDNSSMQGARITVEDAFFRVSNQGGSAFSAWDWAGYAMEFQESGQGYMEGLFWGTSVVAGSRGYRIRSGSVVQYSVKPTANGGDANDVSIGGTVGTYAATVPLFNSTNGAGLVVTA